jgi:hypothetical protein
MSLMSWMSFTVPMSTLEYSAQLQPAPGRQLQPFLMACTAIISSEHLAAELHRRCDPRGQPPLDDRSATAAVLRVSCAGFGIAGLHGFADRAELVRSSMNNFCTDESAS